jgi:hypothetical protein
MRNTWLALTVALLLPVGIRASGPAASATAVSGDYVEARTAEVFTGGCIMGSEGETSGREAILAWRVGHGQMNGVQLDGLSVVAVIAADSNLGTQEVGGAAPHVVKAAIRVDERATPAQREALISMARALAPTLVRDVVDVRAVPIAFRPPRRDGRRSDAGRRDTRRALPRLRCDSVVLATRADRQGRARHDADPGLVRVVTRHPVAAVRPQVLVFRHVRDREVSCSSSLDSSPFCSVSPVPRRRSRSSPFATPIRFRPKSRRPSRRALRQAVCARRPPARASRSGG